MSMRSMRSGGKRGKPEQQAATVRRLLGIVWKHHKAGLILSTVCILLSSLGSAAVPISLKFLLDDFILPLIGTENPDFTGFYRAMGILGAIFAVGVLAALCYTRIMVNIGQNVLKEIRDDMFAHMQRLPIRFFDERPTGQIMSLYTNDTDTLRQMIIQSLPQLTVSFLMVIVTFTAMFILSPLLSVIPALSALLLITVTKFIGSRTGRHFARQQTVVAEMTGFVEEQMEGQKVVKVFNHEAASGAAFDEINGRLCKSSSDANTYANVIGPVIGNIGNLQFIVTAIAGGLLAINGYVGITVGVIASYLQLSKSFTQPFAQIGQQMNSVVMALAGAERIFKLLDLPPEVDEGTVRLVNVRETAAGALQIVSEETGVWAWADGPEIVPLRGAVRIEKMSFGYNPENPVLQDMNLKARPGQKIAFVGATGAGKTTITNLINRFYEVDAGRITYDGIDIRAIRKDDLRRSLGMVLQDVRLFSGTIMENIRYGRLDATDEEVIAAARLAHADGFIRMLPEGYQTVLSGDGAALSQGQRQLLSIARAAVANPPVLILDEATSSIDTRTERIVQRGMDNLMKGRTVFVIAHRLSTIRNSDVILVLDAGRIIEYGNHEALLEEHGMYYRLYTGDLELA